jgi:hypothetical protein
MAMRRRADAGVIAALSLALGCGSIALADGAPDSPRWMYRIEGGVFDPDLDRYSTFFGGRNAPIYGVAAGYRFRDWLELDAEIGRMRDEGVGTIEGSDVLGGDVTYELVPVQLVATFALAGPGRRLVPYLRLGIAAAFYDEDIELQPSRDGRGDVGAAAGLGLRWRFAGKGTRENRPDGRFWRSYVFLEAQRFSSDADTVGGGSVDLGGTSYLTGIRVEFELGPGGG